MDIDVLTGSLLILARGFWTTHFKAGSTSFTVEDSIGTHANSGRIIIRLFLLEQRLIRYLVVPVPTIPGWSQAL